jgi:hypothetical protein
MRTMGRAAMLGVLGWLVLGTAAPACPFCGPPGETLLTLADQSSMVLYGSLRDSKSEKNPEDPAAGTTILDIETVVKPHASFKDSKLTINRYFPMEAQGKYKFLVFCDIYKGKIDPFRGLAISVNSDMPKYLKGALAVRTAPIDKRLRFFFDYLDNEDAEVASDAYKEFSNADYAAVSEVAVNLPPEKLARWMQESGQKQTSYRLGLYGMMLGHAGKGDREKYAKVLRDLLEKADKEAVSGVDGILAGYILLQPKEGWDYLVGILKDGDRPFATRYAALRTTRFFWDSKTEVIAKKDILAAVRLLLKQKDAADLAVEDLRKWEAWGLADEVLDLPNTEAYSLPIVRRAVLRYALVAAPKVPAAKTFVEKMRKSDPTAVSDAEEILRLEQPPAPPPAKEK